MDRHARETVEALPPAKTALPDPTVALPAWTPFEALALFGATWSALFALAHFYWAGGGRLGTSGDPGAISDRPLFLAYDLTAGLVFLAAAAVATLLTSRRPRARLRSRILTATMGGAVLALVRGVGGLAQDTLTFAMGHSLHSGVIYDIWFAVAGAVFLVAARGLRRQGPAR